MSSTAASAAKAIPTGSLTWFYVRMGSVAAFCVALIAAMIWYVATYAPSVMSTQDVRLISRRIDSGSPPRIVRAQQDLGVPWTVPLSQRVVQRDVAQAWALYHEVEVFAYDRARFQVVLTKLTDASAADPYNVEVLNLLARVYATRNEPENAIFYYTKVLNLDRDHLGARQGLATLYLNVRRCDDARPHIEFLRTRRDTESLPRVKRFDRECAATGGAAPSP